MFTFFKLFFRKNFYDGWDNVMFLFIPNLVLDTLLAFCIALCIPGFTILKTAQWYLFVWIFSVALFLCGKSIFSLSWAKIAYSIADYEAIEVKDFFINLKDSIKDGIFLGLTTMLTLLLMIIAIRYFLFPKGEEQTVTFAGLLSGVIYVWISLIVFMALAWYPSLRAVRGYNFAKGLKTCFTLVIDNFFVTIVISFYNIFLFLISFIMLGIAPGMAGIEIAKSNALRLLLKKYDFIKEQKSQHAHTVKLIPWKEILNEDIESNPVRGIRTFWLPWKNDSVE